MSGIDRHIKRARYRVSVLAVSALAIFGVVSGTGTAHASTSTKTQATVAVAGTLTVDCSGLSASAEAYAVAHGYCRASGGPAPLNEESGNCGTSEIYLDDWSGHKGYGIVTYGFDSTSGTVVSRSLEVQYAGTTAASDFTDNSVMFSSSYYSSNYIYLSVGDAFAVLSGSVRLWWGGTCTLANPTSTAYIS
jgi:hypothetical protein